MYRLASCVDIDFRGVIQQCTGVSEKMAVCGIVLGDFVAFNDKMSACLATRPPACPPYKLVAQLPKDSHTGGKIL